MRQLGLLIRTQQLQKQGEDRANEKPTAFETHSLSQLLIPWHSWQHDLPGHHGSDV